MCSILILLAKLYENSLQVVPDMSNSGFLWILQMIIAFRNRAYYHSRISHLLLFSATYDIFLKQGMDIYFRIKYEYLLSKMLCLKIRIINLISWSQRTIMTLHVKHQERVGAACGDLRARARYATWDYQHKFYIH